MRHVLANIVTYSVAALLGLGAAAFAWLRSAQLALVDESAYASLYLPPAPGDDRWTRLGAYGYTRNCANCHGATGEGWDQYPPLDVAASFAFVPEGREWLIDVVLHGLATERWRAPMPRMRHIHDAEVAAILNYVAATFAGRSPETPVLAEEVAARRSARRPQSVFVAPPAAPD